MSFEKKYIHEFLVKSYDQHSEEELFEMSNFYPVDTGLPMTVWIMTKQEYKHKLPRLKFQDENQMLFPISIEDEPKLLVKDQEPKIKSKDLSLLKEWIILNKDALLDHWNGIISTVGLVKQLRKL